MYILYTFIFILTFLFPNKKKKKKDFVEWMILVKNDGHHPGFIVLFFLYIIDALLV